MDNKLELIGILVGSLQGFILAKVYQIWAILYWTEGLRISGKNGWSNTPIWVFSIENPTLFLSVVTVLFALVGLFISKMFINCKNKKQ